MKFDWYRPQYHNVDEMLSKTDKRNISLIQAFEDTRPNSNLKENDLFGEWLGRFPVAAGDYNNIIINSNNTIEFGYNTMYPKAAISCNGTYRIENGYLIVSITEQKLFIGEYFHNGYASVIGGMDGGNNIAKLKFDNPVRMVFPVSNLKENYYGYNIGDVEIRQIGSYDRVKDRYKKAN
jgi:hypothetical protein